MCEDHMYLDADGERIEPGDLLTVPANLKADGKPIMFKGIMTCVGWHAEENNVYVRYMGDKIVHRFHPSRLQIITPKRVRPSLATAA
jgi:hypothetical protein